MKILLLLIVLLFPGPPAHAEPITFGFTGWTLFGFGPFSGSYTFDSDAGPADGGYTFIGPPYGMTIQFTDFTLNWTGLSIGVSNDVPSAVPTFKTDSYTVVVSDGFNPTVFNLKDCDGSAFESNALPLTLDLSEFRPNCSLGDEVVIQHGFFIAGGLTTLFVASAVKVPEPSAGWLLGLGLLGTLVSPLYNRRG